jgi:hypothetical protein
MEIEEVLMLFPMGKEGYSFQGIGSTCDWTPDQERRWTKKDLIAWLSDEGFKHLAKYKYGDLYIKEKPLVKG